ncbi:hypothetical protein [Pseudomonas sp. NPDC096950]|uniref:hypothetical protein n=1 Tax=Pseudomonas sp. NPDC096950 TaxID=3364485 RepID=UPI00383A983E
MSTEHQAAWHDGVATSGNSYLIHRFKRTALVDDISVMSVYSSKCGSVAVKSIDTDLALLAISSRCKRCFKKA